MKNVSHPAVLLLPVLAVAFLIATYTIAKTLAVYRVEAEPELITRLIKAEDAPTAADGPLRITADSSSFLASRFGRSLPTAIWRPAWFARGVSHAAK